MLLTERGGFGMFMIEPSCRCNWIIVPAPAPADESVLMALAF